MRTFIPHSLDIIRLEQELDELQALLSTSSTLAERAVIAPFFKSRPELCAALGWFHSDVELPDRVAAELHLFGDFACDAASGDSTTNSYLLIEFEDAVEYSIFGKVEAGKTVRQWARRFEHGFSQLVDWAWRLSEEGNSTAFRQIFGKNHANIHLLLVIGRDADLSDDDAARLRWRTRNVSLGPFRMTCLTFDNVLHSIRRRLHVTKI
ncbi:Shedu anti-phage system protein SduA domain-containing protein [Mesorhizobium sp.]|uniref:Shedu anti-phage system protein SduA domain-containing protein n=1 Tax=Mesorhizobium sp. TaxID=1871066 RepID=UPI0025D2A426|nr:Shedu anti-phage system protein SduA domain-containing protein [Mesorhizobium sp.]